MQILLLFWSISAIIAEMPDYCATIEYKKSLAIPKPNRSDVKLAQVQIVARHGARAPYYRVYCWDKAPSPVDAHWECGSTQIEAFDSTGRFYKKSFSLPHNILTGTCPVGGLLPLGLEQHHQNGYLLRQTYIGSSALHLFQTGIQYADIPESAIYLRSDNEERTLASGHALVDGFFPSSKKDQFHTRTWHTADMATDIVNTNEKICPRLSYITAQAVQSRDFIDYITSREAGQVQEELQKIVGKVQWGTILECLMIAKCNGIPFPKGMTEELFNHTIQQVERREFLKLTHNNALYAKTNMAPLMNELMMRMEAQIQKDDKAPKLAVVMGHDSTLMPLMAAIFGDSWDGRWAPYASMLIMELYQQQNSTTHFVRMIYKGKPLLIPGCDAGMYIILCL